MFSINSNNTVTNNDREDEDSSAGSGNFSTHTLRSADRYEEYLAGDTGSESRNSNSRNFFDDSDRKDRNWLKIAKLFLRRSAKS